ncbi:MAG TPA: hypothetical protein VFJ07_21695 [Streptosporangiaceae bacterium]|nr:hypothetical protein [Streptosporangiaceae bacterium]
MDAGVRGDRPGQFAAGEPEATAALVFAQALPGGVKLGADDARAYAQWLTGDPPARGPAA